MRPQVATVRKGARNSPARDWKTWTTLRTQLGLPNRSNPGQPRTEAVCAPGPRTGSPRATHGPRVPSWDSAASSARITALETPSPSSGRGGEGLGVLGSPSAAPCAGRSWAELSLWLKAETPQRGGPGLSMRNLRAQTGSPQRTALGIQAGLGRRAPSQLGLSLARNKSLFPETPAPGAETG